MVAALISGAISLGINYWNQQTQKQANRKAAAEQANNAIRQYNETGRQRATAQSLFNNNMSNTYGSGFLSDLTSGKDNTALLSSLAQGDTAFSKRLQAYESDAKQALENSVTSNKMTGSMAQMQGEADTASLLQAKLQAEQASGAAVAAQTVSGIRSDRGTGDNSLAMQEQRNQQTLEAIDLQMRMGNASTMNNLQGTQASASQTADGLRRDAEITAKDTLNNILAQYGSYKAEQADMTESMKAYKGDAEYFKKEAGYSGDGFMTGFNQWAFGIGSEQKNITEELAFAE